MDWKVGLPVLVGEKVWWMKNGQDQPKTGIIKWIGNIPEIEWGWSIGLEMDEPLADGGCDGLWKNRKIFECQPKRGLIVPIQEIRKVPPPDPDFQTRGIEIRSNWEPKESKSDESTTRNHGKSEELELGDQYSSLKLKFGDRDWKNDPGEKKRRSGVFKKCDKSILRLKQNHFLKSKVQEAKASLKSRKRKTHSLREFDCNSLSCRKFEEDLQLVRKSLDARSYFTIDQFLETPNNSDSNVNMNDVAGYFKEIKEDEITNDALKKPSNECEKQLRGLLACDYPEPPSGQNKEKKFFSFLKWFKKNKENSNIKSGSVTSSPVLDRKEHSSCESLDTIFSTQTVRSFAYIPPTQYQPSAPSSSLLGLDLVENGSRKDQLVHQKKKKRKAPDPPSPFVRRITRENSLPSTLDRKQDIQNGCETFHRRTVSESFKDKKAGAYCHVQGKRKAPLPPSKVPALYPNLQKVNPNYQSLQRKKKPAPLPPNQSKNDKTALEACDLINKSRSKDENSFGIPESPKYLRESNGTKENEQPENSSLKVSSSPLPSRPWYKRSQRDSGAAKIFNKMDVLKGFEKKKNKETDDWMPEIGFSRRSFSTDATHNKFTIFSKIDRPEERKKEEKRKSQISILTNISELDKEAAEILRKEQAEEKKMMAENDARYYSSTPLENDLREKALEGESAKKKDKILEVDSKNNKPSEDQMKKKKEIDYNNKTDFNSGMESKAKNDAVDNLNYFDVKNKQVRYLNEPWVCPKCTLENPGWRVFCEICSSVKPHFLYDCNKKSPDRDLGSKKPKEENKEIIENSFETRTENPESNLNQNRVENNRNNFAASKINNEGSGEETNSKKMMMINDSASKRVPEIHIEEKNKIKNKENGEETRGFRKDGAKSENTERDKVSEERKSGAVKKQPIGSKVQPNKNENNKVIEAYVITQTTVLEDIIIKKGDKAVEGPSRTTKNPSRGESVKFKYLRPGENSSSPKKPEPIDLTPSEEDFGEDLKELTKKLSQAEGLADFKATIESMAPEPGSAMNTVAVNKLLKKLETAISNGDQLVAGGLAKELALLKINCSVTRQGAAEVASDLKSKITVNMYVEDKMSHEGPIQVQISPSMTLLQLKKRVHRELGIPVNVQRWILGKKLATDDYRTLESDGVKNDSCPVFLYVMSSVNNEIGKEKSDSKSHKSVEGKNSGTEKLMKDDLSPFKRMEAENKENRAVAGKGEEEGSNEADDHVSGNLIKSENSKSECQANVPDLSMKGDNKSDKPPSSIFRLASRDGENEVEKELKLISANSVKQKVEQLNKTFEENSRKEKSEKELNPTGSWKCLTCTYVNSAGRQICFACSAKKQDQKKKAEAPRIPRPLFASTATSAPKPVNTTKAENGAKSSPPNNIHYDELMKLQDIDVVSNSEPFYCTICLVDYSKGEGIVLKDCLHTFCRPCLINTVQYSEDAEVKCPYFDEKYSCPSVLQQREIKGLVPQKVFDQHLAKSVKEAENKIENAFHCKTADCKGWCIFEDNVNEFHCPVCNLVNCLTCHAIHTGINCKEYQQRMRDASDTDFDARKTREMLEEMVVKGEAMACPKCQIVLMKKWGCDWLRCSMCKTEICWVTRGFRWGPAGKGDTSAGCKCGVNGIKCHPKCNYCH